MKDKGNRILIVKSYTVMARDHSLWLLAGEGVQSVPSEIVSTSVGTSETLALGRLG